MARLIGDAALFEFWQAANATDLPSRREALLGGLEASLRNGLKNQGSDAEAMLADLRALNALGDAAPLLAWLKAARALSSVQILRDAITRVEGLLGVSQTLVQALLLPAMAWVDREPAEVLEAWVGGVLGGDFRPDLVLATGVTPDASPAMFTRAGVFAKQLLDQFNLLPGRLFMVPGPGDRALGDNTALVGMMAQMPAASVFIDSALPMLLAPFSAFAELQVAFAQADGMTAAQPFTWRHTQPKGVGAGVLGFNSAWFGGEPAVVGSPRLAGLSERLQTDRPELVLGLVHHGAEAWAPVERAVLEPLLGRVDLLLHSGRMAEGQGARLSVSATEARFEAFDLRTGALTGAVAVEPLPRALVAQPAVRDGALPRLDTYLNYVEKTWAKVRLIGIVEKEDRPPERVDGIYVPLRTQAPWTRVAKAEWRPLLQGAHTQLEEMTEDSGARAALVVDLLVKLGVDAGPRAVRHGLRRLEALAPRDDAEVAAVLGRWELEQAVAAHRHLLLEGAPGSGKTTTMRAVAAALVRAHGGQTEAAEAFGLQAPWAVPVVVPFREYWLWLAKETAERSEAGHFVEYLKGTLGGHSGAEGWVEPALRAGRVALLLDGLDELPDRLARERAVNAVRDAVAQFSACRWIVTSRPAGLDGFARDALSAFSHHQVQPLDRDQVRVFLERWFARLDAQLDARERATALIAELDRRDELDSEHGLARAPITLVAIALVAARGDLPERRAGLYEQCIKALAHQWDWNKRGASSWLVGDVPERVKVLVLQRIALAAYAAQGEFIERGVLHETFYGALPAGLKPDSANECSGWADHLAERSGLLDRDHRGHFRFRHKTFLEFLAGRALVTGDDDPGTALGRHLGEPYWREVVLLGLGFLALSFPSRARGLLAQLAEQAAAQVGPVSTAAAWGLVAQGALDLCGYGAPGLPGAVEAWKPEWITLLADAKSPAKLQDRIAMGEALGRFGDLRLGWTDAQFPLVPAGPFAWGAAYEDRRPWESEPDPARDEAEFRVGRYLVTVGQFLAFANAEDFADPALWEAGGLEDAGRIQWLDRLGEQNPSLPVSRVTWFEAKAFCAWATRCHALAPGWVYDLPTEAQFEKAGRGGAAGNEWPGRRFPWGEAAPTLLHANYVESKVGGPTPVGVFPQGAGESGALDLAGNLWEWSWDEPAGRLASFLGYKESGSGRVLRGGGFHFEPQSLRVSDRSGMLPSARYDLVGFRCVSSCVAGPSVPDP